MKIVIAVCLLPQKKTLVIRRANPVGDLYWSFPSGKIELNESSEQAALREVQEETGYQFTSAHLYRMRPSKNNIPERSYVLCQRYLGVDQNIVKDVNITETRIVGWNEAQDLFTTIIDPDVNSYMQRYLQHVI